MGIVFVTVPGNDRISFANKLHQKTNGGVDLVVIQKTKKLPLLERLKRLYLRVGATYLPKELWYAFLLRLNGAKRALGYFRARSDFESEECIPQVLETESVNSDEVYRRLKKISPKLMVIWGSAILESRILKTAEEAINLHLGLCPFYKGALANQNAVLFGDFNHVGATIHYAREKVDSGEILFSFPADTTKPPKEMFRDLNDKITDLYADIASRMLNGEKISSKPQNKSRTKNLLLNQWVPSVRYKVGKKLLEREKKMLKLKKYGLGKISAES